MRRRSLLLLFLLLSVPLPLSLLPGCGGNNTYNPALEGPTGPSFSLTVTPPARTVAPGQPAAYAATLTAQGGFDADVTLSMSGLPAGAAAAFDPSVLTPTAGGAGSTIMVTTTADSAAGENRARQATPPGTYPLTVTATGGGIARQAQVRLVVEGGIGVTVNPPTAAVPVGGTQTFTATVFGTTNTAVTWSVQPGGVGGTITAEGLYTAPSRPGTDTVVAVSVAAPTRQGTATVTVQAGNLQGNIQ